MEEKDFEELFNLEEEQIENKTLKKTINKKMHKKIFKSFVMYLIIVVFGIFVCSEVVNTIVYNPYKEDLSVFEERIGYEDDYGEMQIFLINSYLNLTTPGFYYDGSNEIEKKGFGKYVMHGNYFRMFDEILIRGNYQTLELTRSKFKTIPNYQYLGFFSQTNEIRTKADLTSLLDEVKQSSSSTIFEVFVNYLEPIELSNWNASQIPNYNYVYALTRNEMENYYGFNLKTIAMNFFPDHPHDKNKYYPNYFLNSSFEKNNSEDFYAHYKDYLQIMLDHPKFTETMERLNLNQIKEEMEKVNNKQVKVYGYLAYVTKEEMIEILQDSNTADVYFVNKKDPNSRY